MSDNEQVKRESARRTRRSFLVAGVAAAGGYGFYRWIDNAEEDEMIPAPLRDGFRFNHAVSHGVFDERGLAPTYDVSQSEELRINGNYGLKQAILPESYRIQVVGVEGAETMPQYSKDVMGWEYKYLDAVERYEGHDTKEAPKAELAPAFQKAMDAYHEANKNKPQRGTEEAGKSASTLAPGTPGLLLTMDDVKKLPRHELVTQFKCIEGWSEIVHWGGYRLADFIKAYPPARDAQGKLPKYVYMETPNGDYYCGFDMNVCMHPQSLLVTEMAGKPITEAHGAPVRLHMPIKYGYKQIKRIGLIAYTNDKPDDYWTKLGYDWYAGL